MRNHIELDDRTRLPLDRLPDRVPSTAFFSPTHLEVCETLAARTEMPIELRGVYLNLLFRKSSRARQLTALITLVRAGRIRPRRLRADFAAADLAPLLGESIAVETLGAGRAGLIDRSHFLRFIVKALWHRAFHLLRRRNLRDGQLLRAACDISDATYPELKREATYLIYPFHQNVMRQWRFARTCARERRRWSLMGIPYRLRDMAAMILRPDRWESRLVRAETQGQLRHAEALAAMGARTVFAGDEFEVAGCRLHQRLAELGVRSVGTHHGVAVYGPVVYYTEGRFFHEGQQAFYERHGCIERASLRRLAIAPAPSLDGEPYRPEVVYLLGNWHQMGKRYEERFERAAIPRASELCHALGLPFSVKLHPNTRRLEGRLARRWGVPVFFPIERLEGKHPIFLNLLSTAYYAFLNRGPTIFLRDELIDPAVLFGPQPLVCPLEELQSALAPLRDRAAWVERLTAQLDRERRLREEQSNLVPQATEPPYHA